MKKFTYINILFLFMFILACMIIICSLTHQSDTVVDAKTSSTAVSDNTQQASDSISVPQIIEVSESTKLTTTTVTNTTTTYNTTKIVTSTTKSKITSAVSTTCTSQSTTSSSSISTTVTAAPKVPCTNKYINLTAAEMRDLATLVYLEAGGESYECQLAVASVVINRMTTSNKSLNQVIYEKNQFSTAKLVNKYQPSDSTTRAVEQVCTSGPSIPQYVTYFRANRYHSFSSCLVNYKCIDDTYFSYDSRLKAKFA